MNTFVVEVRGIDGPELVEQWTSDPRLTKTSATFPSLADAVGYARAVLVPTTGFAVRVAASDGKAHDVVGERPRAAESARSPYFTTEEAAAYCRYDTPFGLLKARSRGKVVAAVKRGRSYLWLREDLDRFMRGDQPPPVMAPTPAPIRGSTSARSGRPRTAQAPRAPDPIREAAIRRIREISLGAPREASAKGSRK